MADQALDVLPAKPSIRVERGKLRNFREACRLALQRGLTLGIECDEINIPVWVDERVALVALDAETEHCYGVLQWNPELDSDGCVYVNWLHSDDPRAFTALVLKFRDIAKYELKARGISFNVYGSNERMHKVARSMRAKVQSVSYDLIF